MTLLDVAGLRTEFATPTRAVAAVDGLSFQLRPGEILGLVGESGSGKTVACRSLLRLLPSRRARIAAGTVMFENRDLMRLSEAEMRVVRGRDIAMIFQNPASHLDPVFTVGDLIAEPLIWHFGESRRAARKRAVELLRQVGIPDPAGQIERYPHQFSGGMKQRVMIAAALACEPKILLADEPTTALDVTVQAQILRLLLDLRDRTGLAIVLVTHDIGVVAETCDSVVVLYSGRVMECGGTQDVLTRPRHPYTRGLLDSLPTTAARGAELPSISGYPPPLDRLPQGCRFHPRCRFAIDRCRREPIELETVDDGHASACVRWREVMEVGP
ncbi:ABC transporter ATP-binding protein [Ferruginivarius sediminum]|uniref:ABC transporter ATP-binding protein n=1 Tax=Ferruginivarius sediminum TaxID=2661937 RepID=A0A369T6X7_9PROT|nr:ABC transporter ATP-binding protein [Ferruginivarius sediminum]RDD61083.1 ABC transporter ATP-binding protein [Ferruginivarius sediminum]